jgi:DNA-binding NtrC family response regulator
MRNRAGELPTMKRSKGSANADGPPAFVLSVVEGPDAGATFTIDGTSPARTLVGTSPLCTARLSDPQVSRRHASLRATSDALALMDLGSTNGTTVNGVAIKEAFLRGGEAVRIGATVLSVTRAELGAIAKLARAESFGRLLGASRAMRKLYPVLERLASTNAPVLLEGEAGTGKELCAEELHAKSARAESPFIVLETGSLSSDAAVERLFGPDDLVHAAGGGTLFVDEVGNLPLDAQARLLRHLEDGGVPTFILATQRDLDRAVAEKRFDEDLLAKLAASRVELPPLREREGDVALLAKFFWSELRRGADDAVEESLPGDLLPRFEHHPWPGNVPELRQAVEARMTLGAHGKLRGLRAPAAGGDFIASVASQDLPFSRARQLVVDELERQYVGAVLARHGGNVGRAAAASGLELRYFQLMKARRNK